MFTAHEIFSIAVRLEENGERFYRDALADHFEPSLQRLLLRLADEEANHREFFLGIKNSLEAGSGPKWAAQIGEAILQSAIKDRPFSLEETETSFLQSEEELIQVALGLEEDSIRFYEILLDLVEDAETARCIHQILEEEKRHYLLLGERLPCRGC